MPTLPFQFSASAEDASYAKWKAAVGLEKDKAASELLAALAGNIMSAVMLYQTAPLPKAAVELEAKRIAMVAIRDWREGTGRLGAYVSTKVRQGLYDYVTRHQNVASIPAEHIARIGSYKRTVEGLTDTLGRDPTAVEISEHMSIPLKKVTTLQKMLRPTAMESLTVATTFDDVDDADRERVRLAYYGFTDQEKLVFDYTTGAHGRTKLSTNDIAKKLGVTAARVSAIKSNLADKIAPYVERR